MKIDLLFQSNGTDAVFSYQGALAFDPTLFDPALNNYTPSTSSFDLQAPAGKANITGAAGAADAPFTRVFTDGESHNAGNTVVLPNAPTQLGVYSFKALRALNSGEVSQILFTDLLPTKPSAALLNTYKLNNATTPTSSPNFSSGTITLSNNTAPVPEAGTLVGLATLLVPAFWTLRRKNVVKAA